MSYSSWQGWKRRVLCYTAERKEKALEQKKTRGRRGGLGVSSLRRLPPPRRINKRSGRRGGKGGEAAITGKMKWSISFYWSACLLGKAGGGGAGEAGGSKWCRTRSPHYAAKHNTTGTVAGFERPGAIQTSSSQTSTKALIQSYVEYVIAIYHCIGLYIDFIDLLNLDLSPKGDSDLQQQQQQFTDQSKMKGSSGMFKTKGGRQYLDQHECARHHIELHMQWIQVQMSNRLPP